MQKANANETLQKQLADLNIETPSSPDTEVSETLSNSERMRRSGSRLAKAAVKKIPAIGLGIVTGGTSFIADTAAMALETSPTAFSSLDPVEEIMGRAKRRSLFASDDMSDTELLERMQAASSQRFSPDMAKRTTALADIKANRGRLEERGFSPIARQQVEQSQRDLRESGLGDYGETTQAESMRQLFSELQDVDTSEAFTEQAKRARIAAQAAQLFNR